MLPLQGKRPQDAGVQLCAPLQQHPPHHLEAVPYHQGQPGQMVVPGTHQGQALPAAYQAITRPLRRHPQPAAALSRHAATAR